MILDWHAWKLNTRLPLFFRYKERRYLIDVTEVFRGISFEKKLRYTKLGFYVFLFIMVVFR